MTDNFKIVWYKSYSQLIGNWKHLVKTHFKLKEQGITYLKGVTNFLRVNS